MNYRLYRKQWLKWHKDYELWAYRLIRKRLRERTLMIPFESYNQSTLEFYLSDSFFNELYYDIYSSIGIKHGKRVGKHINKQIKQKEFGIDTFTNEFILNLQRYLIQTAGQNIRTVKQTYVDYILQLINQGVSEGRTLPEITTDLTKLIKSRGFYKYQAFRIARTETSTAANYAAFTSSRVSGVAMDKVWLSSQDKRTRRTPPDKFDHYHMNEVRVPLEEPFNVDGEKLMFPADQESGSAENIINCRCTMAQVVRRDKDGNIVRI